LIEDVLKKYPNEVKVVFKNFPLGSHKQARKAGQYALAAGRQDKFKELYMALFDEKDTWRQLRSNEDLPLQLAGELGMDVGQMQKDMNDPALDKQINEEYNQLKSLGNAYDTDQYAGVRLAVPKFFINGREPAGRSLDAFSKMIDEELKK
jgi:predicted DsbA family dithiol-disulfide isomerase